MSQSHVQHRDILFHTLPNDQTVQAARFLNGLRGVKAQAFHAEQRIAIAYSIHDYCLRELETFLSSSGFHLENTLLQKIKRALIYYCEEIEKHNLSIPVKDTKALANPEIYVKIYEGHLHGDHDNAPEELRREF